MVLSIRPLRWLATARAATCLLALAASGASPPVLAAAVQPAGRDSGHDFTIDPDSIHRDGSTVTFHLVGTSYRGVVDDYDAQVMVDCAQRQRRELGSEIRNQWIGVKHNRPDSQMRDIFPNTRQATELELVCRLAGVPVARVADMVAAAAAQAPAPTPAPAPALPHQADVKFGALPLVTTFALPTGARAQATATPHVAERASAAAPLPAPTLTIKANTVLPADDLLDLGNQDGYARAILIDSVRHKEQTTSYVVQSLVPGATWATRDHYVVDCQRKLRAFQPDDLASGVRLTATRVAANSHESRELATACAMPDGPSNRWFAGFVVTNDGVVVAPHLRTGNCVRYSTGFGAKRRPLQFIAHDEDLTLLKLQGSGSWSAMPAIDTPASRVPQAVTMLGVKGVAPRVSAGNLTMAGSNSMDTGWPQVVTFSDHALSEGIVWDADGAAIGLALAPEGRVGNHAFMRMLPTAEIRLRLARHGLTWTASDGQARNAEATMRLALAATLPIECERAP
ncbi:MAG: hypothetical protein ABIR54_03560 [Burkholderiaceae bacterium]